MGILDIFRSRESRANPLNNPAVSLSSPAIWSWITGGEPTAAGEEVNHFTAMQAVSVYACVRVIAESVASLPLKLYEKNNKGRLEAVDVPLYDLLAVAPNVEMSAFTFWETLTGCLTLTGNAYAQIDRDKGKRITSLLPLHPLKTEPYRKKDGTLAYRTTDGEATGYWVISLYRSGGYVSRSAIFL
jgi:phage portal protein BeeE